MHNNYNHNLVMFIIMILSGALSTMNMWVDKYDDIRFSLNDLYMIGLMTGWMFFFMGIVYRDPSTWLFGFLFVIIFFWCIRTQFLVTQNQYLLGMIPHHSMAVHMSKRLLEKENNIQKFLQNIVSNQSREIDFMKKNSF